MLALLLSCIPEPIVAETGAAAPPKGDEVKGPEGHGYTRFDGTARWRWGWSTTTEDYGCDLAWSTVGTTDPAGCPDCTWSFTVTFTYDEAASRDEADCFAGQDSKDFTWRIGLQEDFYDYGYAAMYLYDDGAYGWAFAATPSWRYPQLDWSIGPLDAAYTSGDQLYYYSSSWSGSATVQ